MRLLLATGLLYFSSLLSTITGQSQGWSLLFEDEISEFHDEELTWEAGGEKVPTWLQGRYIKNGPAQLKFPNQTRFFTNWMDGWAKLHSFTFNGSEVKFSGKMLESPLYKASLEAGDLVPSTTLSGLTPSEWTMKDKLDIAGMFTSQTAFDNDNVIPVKLGDEYFAATDWPTITYFDPESLDTLDVVHPKQIAIGQCAHWITEPGTLNKLNFQLHLGVLGTSFHLYRWRPGDLYTEPEQIAHFTPKMDSVIHSFSATETHAIFFFYPYIPNLTQMWSHNFHVFEVMEWHDQDMEVAVIRLADGHVDRFSAPPTFSAHHANAYNMDDGKFVLDLCPVDYEIFGDLLLLENAVQPSEDSPLAPNGNFTRFIIDVEQKSLTKQQFGTVEDFPQFSQFEFPTINEKYRGKKYCWVYGWVSINYYHHTLVKRNVCGEGGEKMFYMENHYSGEAIFVPAPGGEAEDDGVLMTIGFDGVKEQSYLFLLNATDFTVIDRAYTQHIVPLSFHGAFF